MPLTLTLVEVARRIGVSEPTARRIVADWPTVRVGGRKRYPSEALDNYIRREWRQPHTVHVTAARHTL
jgi:hypothetical protein